MAQAQGKLSSKAQSENTLYYDKLGEQDSDDTKQCWKRCWNKIRCKKENKVGDEVEAEKKHDFAVSYKDMEKLLAEIHICQDALKQ